MNSTMSMPPELVAYIDGICDAGGADESTRAMMMEIMGPIFEALKDGISQGISAEREECAKLADAEAKRVRYLEEFAPREGAEAFRDLAAAIRGRK